MNDIYETYVHRTAEMSWACIYRGPSRDEAEAAYLAAKDYEVNYTIIYRNNYPILQHKVGIAPKAPK